MQGNYSTVTNHKGHRQYSEPMKTRSDYMKLTESAGKRARVNHDWFGFYFWLDEKVSRASLSNRVGSYQSLLDTQKGNRWNTGVKNNKTHGKDPGPPKPLGYGALRNPRKRMRTTWCLSRALRLPGWACNTLLYTALGNQLNANLSCVIKYELNKS